MCFIGFLLNQYKIFCNYEAKEKWFMVDVGSIKGIRYK